MEGSYIFSESQFDFLLYRYIQNILWQLSIAIESFNFHNIYLNLLSLLEFLSVPTYILLHKVIAILVYQYILYLFPYSRT